MIYFLLLPYLYIDSKYFSIKEKDMPPLTTYLFDSMVPKHHVIQDSHFHVIFVSMITSMAKVATITLST